MAAPTKTCESSSKSSPFRHSKSKIPVPVQNRTNQSSLKKQSHTFQRSQGNKLASCEKDASEKKSACYKLRQEQPSESADAEQMDFKEDPAALTSILQGQGISYYKGTRSSLYYQPPSHRLSLRESLAEYQLQRRVIRESMLGRASLAAPLDAFTTPKSERFNRRPLTEIKENQRYHTQHIAPWHTTSKLQRPQLGGWSHHTHLRRLTEEFEAVRISGSSHTPMPAAGESRNLLEQNEKLVTSHSSVQSATPLKRYGASSTFSHSTLAESLPQSDLMLRHSKTPSMPASEVTPTSKQPDQGHASRQARPERSSLIAPALNCSHSKVSVATPSVAHTPRCFTPLRTATPARVRVEEPAPSPSPMRSPFTPSSASFLHRPPARVPALSSCMKNKKRVQFLPSRTSPTSVKRLRWADVQSPTKIQRASSDDAADEDGDVKKRCSPEEL